MTKEEPLSITMLATGQSATVINGEFVFSQVLIDCLLRLKCNDIDKDELLSSCKTEYQDNKIELEKLTDFEKNYSYNKVLWWYTRDAFFYRTLNAALRRQDTRMIVLYRSFISDIYRQLQYHQCKEPIRVYRSQLISIEEIKKLQQFIGQFVSMNSFLSTSSERPIALFYAGDQNQVIDLERVLFEIDADPLLTNAKPFADISSYSCFQVESEVLFMLGSIFRLNNISKGEDQIWTIQMTLCSDDEHDLKQVLMDMKNQNGIGETNLYTLGKLLWKMGELTLAKKYYKQLRDELPTDDPLLAVVYEELGTIASQTRNRDKAVQLYQKALEIKNRHLKPVSILSTRPSKRSFGLNSVMMVLF